MLGFVPNKHYPLPLEKLFVGRGSLSHNASLTMVCSDCFYQIIAAPVISPHCDFNNISTNCSALLKFLQRLIWIPCNIICNAMASQTRFSTVVKVQKFWFFPHTGHILHIHYWQVTIQSVWIQMYKFYCNVFSMTSFDHINTAHFLKCSPSLTYGFTQFPHSPSSHTPTCASLTSGSAQRHDHLVLVSDMT